VQAEIPSRCSPVAYLAAFFASFAALLAGAGALSYRYDPGEQFHKPGSRAVAAALLTGESVLYDKNLDLRLVMRTLAARAPVPRVALFGSSVSANASAAELGEPRFLNLSVNGGTIVDAVGLLDVYRARGEWPRRVVLWLNGASFDPDKRDLRWLSLASEIRRTSARLGAPVTLPRGQGLAADVRQLLSWSYVSESARAWLRPGGFAHARPVPADWAARTRVLRPDGSRSWGDFDPGVEGAGRSAREAVAQGYAERLTRFARAPGGLAQNPRLALLEGLLAELAGQGVEVTLLTTPFAPAALEALRARGEGAAWLEAFGALDRALARAARAHGAHFAGGSVPRERGRHCGPSGHLDFHHLRDACLAHHLQAALDGGARVAQRPSSR